MESSSRMFPTTSINISPILTPDSRNPLFDTLFSASTSPTKPLAFPSMPPVARLSRRLSIELGHILRKEFNSSSDTYVSENSETSEKNTLLQRNFEDNENLEKTASHLLDLTINNHNSTQKSSPSRSIMKSSTSISGSPRKLKTVNFQEQTPEIHHYQQFHQQFNEDQQSNEEIHHPITHNWSAHAKKANLDLEKSSTSPPPVPPPHSSNTISSLLAEHPNHNNDDIDVGSLAKYKLNHGSFSNLSLNEKLDLYLGSSSRVHHDPTDHNNLDDHLRDLNEARDNETDANIHHLSAQLELPQQTPMENPLNALSESHDVYLRSAGSSQSSLPSLVDSNRYLHSQTIDNSSPGLKLNEGMKHFPDQFAHSVVPSTAANTNFSRRGSEPLSFGIKPRDNAALFQYSGSESEVSSAEEMYHDSFDQSYNSTEKSIMKLLNSASSVDMLSKKPPSKSVKQEESSFIKNEPDSSINESYVIKKQELSNQFDQSDHESDDEMAFKDENLSNQSVNKEEYLLEFKIPLPPHPEQDSSRAILTDLQRSSSRLEELDQDVPQAESPESPENHEYVKNSDPESQIQVQVPEHIQEQIPETQLESPESHKKLLETSECPEIEAETSECPENEAESAKHPENEARETPNVPEIPHEALQSPEIPGNPETSQSHENPDSSEMNDISESQKYISNALPKIKIEPQDHENGHVGDSGMDFSTEPLVHSVGVASKILRPRRSAVKLVKSTPEGSLKQEDISGVQEEEADNEESEEDEEDQNGVKSETSRDIEKEHPLSSRSSIDRFEDSSEIPQMRTLAPQVKKVDEVVDATNPPAEVMNQSKVLPGKRTMEEQDSSILANSSNIHPPSNLRLPSLDSSDHSLTNFSKKINESASMSYEESLSAENEKEKPNLDFISIWHSQKASMRKQQQPPEPIIQQKLNVRSIDAYNTANLSQYDRYKVPTTLQPKQIREANLVSRRVVSPGQEDLHVSGFLPEISHVSGFEDHLHSLIGRDESEVTLSEADETKQTSQIRRNSTRRFSRSLRPVSVLSREIHVPLATQNNTVKRSKFHVPSFEIKRSSSMLSPKHQYDDIFADTVFIGKPTMRAAGMKTLPSMEKDDVKKIMQMKHAMTQDEYSHLKFGGAHPKYVVQGLAELYDHMQQKASIHSESVFSTPLANEEEAPATEKSPACGDHGTIGINGVFGESPVSERDPEPDTDLISENNASIHGESPGVSGRNADIHGESPHIDGDNGENILRLEIPHADTPRASSPALKVTTPHGSPKKGSRKGSPIKIGSPIKVVKRGNAVAGVALDAKKRQEDVNMHKYALSTVSVPTQAESEVAPSPEIENFPKDSPKDSANSAKSSQSSESPKERGRLFVRVIGLKNIALPNLYERNALFNMTLDNGVHCIKTPNYKMDKLSVLVGKEFELTVGETLEFILTMKAEYEKPRGNYREVRETRSVRPKSRMGKFFGSRDVVTTTRFVPQQAHDSWKGLVANDGSFARCYVDLAQYENHVTGKAGNFNLNCFNEWVASGQPYTVAQLEVKMLFIPRTEPYEILPTSIKAAYEGLEDLKKESTREVTGYLHQEGGDCDTWKKRYFVLKGTSMVAHSEYSHKPRAKINLSKVVEVIYVDKENINRSSSNYRNFSDIFLVEHAFKVRFSNGEIIDFGAPNKEEKNQWIQAIQEVVYRNRFRRQPWVKAMQERNRRVNRIV